MSHRHVLEGIHPVLKSIGLVNNDSIQLGPGSVVALVGPNNAGKTHFLNHLRVVLAGRSSNTIALEHGLISKVQVDYQRGRNLDTFFIESWCQKNMTPIEGQKRWIQPDPEGFPRKSNYLSIPDLQTMFSQGAPPGDLVDLFIRIDDPLSRVAESDKKRLGDNSPVDFASKDDNAATGISTYFREIFDESISFY